MKTFRLFLLLIFSSVFLFAQAPEKMSYQAVVRDSDDMLVKTTTIGMRISIIQNNIDGTTVYSETHRPVTNENGLVTLEIGGGSVVEGSIAAINWAKGPFFLKVETDIKGGTNYTIIGASQLLSVPYALYAKKAESLDGSITETDPAFEGAEKDNLLTYDGTNWVAKDLVLGQTGGGQEQNNMQPWLAVSFCIALQGIFPSRNAAEPFLAEIMMFGGNFAPRGWAFCDGQILSIAQNTALFSLLGTTYGGDGRTTFGLPDLRGRVPLHHGNGTGLTDRKLGQKGGTETNTMTIQQMPAHTHSISYD